jgi:hypothetical protein
MNCEVWMVLDRLSSSRCHGRTRSVLCNYRRLTWVQAGGQKIGTTQEHRSRPADRVVDTFANLGVGLLPPRYSRCLNLSLPAPRPFLRSPRSRRARAGSVGHARPLGRATPAVPHQWADRGPVLRTGGLFGPGLLCLHPRPAARHNHRRVRTGRTRTGPGAPHPARVNGDWVAVGTGIASGPAQIGMCGVTASGSYFGRLASTRSLG